jgi:hypothetical protein
MNNSSKKFSLDYPFKGVKFARDKITSLGGRFHKYFSYRFGMIWSDKAIERTALGF